MYLVKAKTDRTCLMTTNVSANQKIFFLLTLLDSVFNRDVSGKPVARSTLIQPQKPEKKLKISPYAKIEPEKKTFEPNSFKKNS